MCLCAEECNGLLPLLACFECAHDKEWVGTGPQFCLGILLNFCEPTHYDTCQLVSSQGLRHGCSAVDVLQGLISQLQSNGVLCKLDLSSFSINVSILGLSFNSSLHPVHSYVYVALNCICQFMKVATLVGGKLEVYFIIK
jgi:hypothetical protein